MNTQKNEALKDAGFVRIKTILSAYPISRSTWYAGIKAGVFPAPVKLSERTSAWRIEDIRALFASHDRPANDGSEQK